MSGNAGPLKRHGIVVPTVELRCPRCHRGRSLSEGEAAPLKRGLVPYCADCLLQGEKKIMKVRWYKSGPTDLIV